MAVAGGTGGWQHPGDPAPSLGTPYEALPSVPSCPKGHMLKRSPHGRALLGSTERGGFKCVLVKTQLRNGSRVGNQGENGVGSAGSRHLPVKQLLGLSQPAGDPARCRVRRGWGPSQLHCLTAR